MSKRTRIAAAATISALITVSTSATATAAQDDAFARTATAADAAAEGDRGAERAMSEWSVAHGTAKASGLIRPADGKSAISGELRNSGPGCYSLTIQFTLGSFPGPITKVATICGSETVPVYREYAGRPLIKVCRDTAAAFTDCGPAQQLPEGSNAPQGYVYEAAWLATPDYCRSEGEKGIAEGRWTAYVCRQEYRGADVPLLHQVLYVKK
ncbi:hypothetical protein [Streptomyces djakartensis]|uniref:Uncharacterized protein n=1 Tax=Streptomyces djakartensis TaxID=68193 RepID=A0ABQ2ZT60_9ACTN|nr:hypothetical protein [Streptomyces djakartensis]GGY22072.1 hypothetical protein GCM10010384_30950 [Streptomyces djakartensis]